MLLLPSGVGALASPCCGVVSGPRHRARPQVSTSVVAWSPDHATGPDRRSPRLLWRGLRTTPQGPTAGLHVCCGVVSGPRHRARPQVSPPSGIGDLRSGAVARSGDRATTGGPAGPALD